MNINNAYNESDDTSLDFHRPTQEEHESAKNDMANLGRWIRTSKERQTALIDELAQERESEKMYTKLYEQKKDICRMYEIYMEIESQPKGKGKKNE